jgi:hypothetical protein
MAAGIELSRGIQAQPGRRGDKLFDLAAKARFEFDKAMKTFSPTDLFRHAGMAAAVIFVSGCAIHEQCPAKYSQHYVDTTHHFSLCLPSSATQGDAGGYPSGSILFNGFPVPAGTNLDSKRLIIVPGKDPDMQDITPNGHLTVDGVDFKRATGGEGSAGHLTQYIFYTWKQNGHKLDFEFSLYSANVLDYPPATRPAQFDYPAQVQSIQDIMETFHRVP